MNARRAHEHGKHARLVVYLAAAPGAGKTRRLLSDARRLQDSGLRVMIGWIGTNGQAELERLAETLPQLPLRGSDGPGDTFPDFDLDAALLERPDVIIVDELGEGGAAHARWQRALKLRDAGISVLGALDVAQLETARSIASELPVQAATFAVPLSFLKTANEVIAIDASRELLRGRNPSSDFSETTFAALRELLLRTVDALTIATTAPASASTAVAIVPHGTEPAHFLARSAPVANAMDLGLEILPDTRVDMRRIEELAAAHIADVLPPADSDRVDVSGLHASVLCVPTGPLGKRLVNMPVERDIFVVDAQQSYLETSGFTTPLSGTIGDRMRVGYGKLTVYLGATAGTGKTYSMLDRAQQLRSAGIDVAIGFIDARGRSETQAMVDSLEVIAATGGEMDRDAVFARKPRVVVVDDLAHTNAEGSLAAKRYLDVLAFLRAGMDVLTTLNVAQLEALSDVVYRLTGRVPRETLPDGILPLADEVILVDASPETLRERLTQGKIYPPERVEPALNGVFRKEILASLRELAIREVLRAKTRQRLSAPFGRLLVSVVSREEDLQVLRKAGRLAARMEVDFTIAHVAEKRDRIDENWVAEIGRIARTINAELIDTRGVDDASDTLLKIARQVPETVVAVGGTHRRPRWPAKPSFARRLLDHGARELFVLSRTRPLVGVGEVADGDV